jgi:phosphatidylglycerophosphatase A
MALGVIVLGIPAATIVERESMQPDPGRVVVDEVAGQWIALIYSRADVSHMLGAFLFFRLFDILKPWPARQLEKLPAGWGIVFDDVAAGVYALLVVQALQYWIGH